MGMREMDREMNLNALKLLVVLVSLCHILFTWGPGVKYYYFIFVCICLVATLQLPTCAKCYTKIQQ